MDYFGRILEFALVTLRKLSAPLVEDELNTNHQKFLKELGENTRGRENSTALFASLVIKGLQFVLRQIKVSVKYCQLWYSYLDFYNHTIFKYSTLNMVPIYCFIGSMPAHNTFSSCKTLS